MAAAPDVTHTEPPRPGAHQSFTSTSALRLLSEVCHVSPLALTPIQRGYNNQTYIASISPPASPLPTAPGLPPIPAGTEKLVVRFSNPPPGQERRKTENEVAVLSLIEREAPAVPVPRVYAWDNDASNAYGSEYIVESFLPGVCLGECWEEVAGTEEGGEEEGEGARAFLEDLARVLGRLKAIAIPGDRFGGFAFDQAGAVTIKESVLGYGGPSSSLHAYYSAYLSSQLANAQSSPALRGFSAFPSLSARLAPSALQALVARTVHNSDMSPTLIHGDISIQNLLVAPATKRITGLVDFEFAYAGPALEEFCMGFADFGRLAPLLVPDPFEGRDTLPESAEGRRVRALSHPDALGFSDHARHFVQQLKAEGVFVPSDLGAERLGRYARVYWLGQALCPWTFMQDMPDAFWAKKGREERVREAAEAVGWMMDELEK